MDSNAAELGTAQTLERLCGKGSGLVFSDTSTVLQTLRQTNLQTEILLYACGGCVALIALLLLGSTLSLEAEGERRSYAVLCAIGMSAGQMRRRICGKAAGRGFFAVAAGWLLYLGFLGLSGSLRTGESILAEVQYGLQYLKSYDFPAASALALSAACFAAAFGISLIAKRRIYNGKRQTVYRGI